MASRAELVDTPLVAVVVLSWNGREDTLTCLRSIAHSDYPRLITVVVDNGSVDGSAAAVAAEFAEAELLELPDNRGFAGGANAGIERALELGADFVFLLNNDTTIDPKSIVALVEEAGHRSDAGSLGSLLFYAEPPDLIWFAGMTLDLRKGYRGRSRGYRQQFSERFADPFETDAACAAALLIPRDAIDRAGLLDEDLFAYYEDVEWSLRVRAAGLRHYVVPASRVWHHVSLSSGGENAATTLYYNLRNSLTVAERYAPLGPLGRWRRGLVALTAHLAQASRAPHRLAAIRAVLAGWRDFRRGRLGPRRAA